jgi:hypothetical protein
MLVNPWFLCNCISNSIFPSSLRCLALFRFCLFLLDRSRRCRSCISGRGSKLVGFFRLGLLGLVFHRCLHIHIRIRFYNRRFRDMLCFIIFQLMWGRWIWEFFCIRNHRYFGYLIDVIVMLFRVWRWIGWLMMRGWYHFNRLVWMVMRGVIFFYWWGVG